MFSSNDTPMEEFQYADKLGATINLDDITHIDFLEKAIGHIPERISCRYNPGGLFKISNDIMDNPGDAKYGMTTEQMTETDDYSYEDATDDDDVGKESTEFTMPVYEDFTLESGLSESYADLEKLWERL